MERVVQMVTTISENGVSYEVWDGDMSAGARGNPFCIWTRHVAFGQDESHRAGGSAFVETAQEQFRIAGKLASDRMQKHLPEIFSDTRKI